MKWLLDSNIVVLHLNGRLADRLPEGEYFVSVITELETLSWPGLDDAAEQILRTFLSNLTIVDLHEPIKRSAVAIRRQRLLKLPDAIVLATARSLGATLLTNDQRILQVESAGARSVILKT